MAIAILQGVGGGKTPQQKSIKVIENGDYSVHSDEGYELERVDISVDVENETQEKHLDINSDGSYEITPDAGYALSKVTVNVAVPSEDLEAVISEQEALIAKLEEALEDKASGGDGEYDPRSEYQRVEYITSDGDSYIFTDFVADNTCGLELVASFPDMLDRIPMGSREDTGNTRFYCVYPLSTTSVYYGFNAGASASCSTKVNTIYRLQTNFLNSRLICVYEEDGTRKVNNSINATLTQHTVPVSIFGYNSASSETVLSKREFKLYSARCSRGHEVVREYIPCYRKSDGVIGLYEKFTGAFHENDGTGAFTKGADMDW